jgi:hypothetical protein
MGDMTDDEIISDKFREAYKDFLQHLPLNKLQEELWVSYYKSDFIKWIIEEDPTGSSSVAFEDIRANL